MLIAATSSVRPADAISLAGQRDSGFPGDFTPRLCQALLNAETRPRHLRPNICMPIERKPSWIRVTHQRVDGQEEDGEERREEACLKSRGSAFAL
jgi:hypothetical protein